MNKIRNEKITFQLTKNGKPFKSLDIKNRLTNLYLNYVLDRQLDLGLVSDTDGVEYFNSYAYLKFDTTQTITDSSTTMDYDLKSYAITTADVTTFTNENSRKITTTYYFDFSTITNGQQFMGLGFGRDDIEATDYLLAFVDLSLLNLDYDSSIGFIIARTDEIVSNEISTTPTYLTLGEDIPLTQINFVYSSGGKDEYPLYYTWLIPAELDIITRVDDYTIQTSGIFGRVPWSTYTDVGNKVRVNFGGVIGIYTVASFNDSLGILVVEEVLPPNAINKGVSYNQIAKRYQSPGYAILDGFYNYYQGVGLYPSDTLYPGTIYPMEQGGPIKAEFIYALPDTTTITTYVNIQDLDITYHDKTMSINVKVERGDY